MSEQHQWSTVQPLLTGADKAGATWIPAEDRPRIAAYLKYDEMYWNDGNQYALRVLEGEQPLYIPNARQVVDTTAHYLLKGLKLESEDQTTQEALDKFLEREAFMSKFHSAKLAGVARGDFILHMTANPAKEQGKRISINAVEPMNVFPIWDEDEPGKMVGCHLATAYYTTQDPDKMRVRRLTYRIEEKPGQSRRISREEHIFEIDPNWYGPTAKKVKTILKFGYLDPSIQAIPIYWFKNRHWDGEDYGSSELRGIEILAQTVSQGSTDVSAALALEGLGVYATDGGRPVIEGDDGQYNEGEWEVAPGKVMEVPTGSYFRRVEGVGSITPAVDQISYLEKKMMTAAGLSDVALGNVDAQIASSGIALAIKFMPTLAKIETRDETGKDRLRQLFYDWKTWHSIFERELLTGDIVPVIGDKLPVDRVARVNELNNMIDRQLIPKSYYRSEMEKLGYTFPEDIEEQLDEETKKATEAARAAFMATRDAEAEANAEADDKASDDEETSTAGETLPQKGNKSNNAKRPNESAGTEAK